MRPDSPLHAFSRALHRLPGVPDQLADGPDVLLALAGAGVLEPMRPDRATALALRSTTALLRHGPSVATGYAIAAARHPEATAVIDDRGSLSFAEVDRMSGRLAAGLASVGVRSGDSVGVLLRNSRYVLLTLSALGRLGADALLLNTGFAAPQATEVMRRHDARAVMHDQEFVPVVDDAAAGRARVLGWVDGDVGPGAVTVDELIARGGPAPRRGWRDSNVVLLTSGTTGTPKGAPRGARNAATGVNLLHAMPFKAARTVLVASPVFHAWGLAVTGLALLLGSPVVLHRRFDAEATLRAIEDHRVDAMGAVPVLLQRLVDLPEDVRRRYDTTSLRVVGVSGSALPGDLAQRFMDAFGDVVFNMYGSTEVGDVSVASPADLRAAPGTAGRPLPGVRVELLDDADRPVPRGEVGRIFVGSGLTFSGYSSGEDKRRVRGMVSSGDLGRWDEHGLLIVTGRDDDMIVSGGENVYPAEVEDLLAAQPEIAEAAVVGVDDERFGQRLVAHVVLRDGAVLTEDELRDRVRQRLAGYKVPREVRFCAELPRNATGKVLKKDLPG